MLLYFFFAHFITPGPTRLTPVMIRDGPVECNPRPLLCTHATQLQAFRSRWELGKGPAPFQVAFLELAVLIQ
jgi:hypothetical protein